jgi:hypothetical protein
VEQREQPEIDLELLDVERRRDLLGLGRPGPQRDGMKYIRPGTMPRSTLPIATSYFSDRSSTTLSLTRSNGNVSWNASTNVTMPRATSPA